MRKNIKIFIFLAVLCIPMLAWGVLLCVNHFNPQIMDKIDFDLGENRKKNEFPEKFDKDFFKKLEGYYNDRVPFRAVIIQANREVNSKIEIPYDKYINPYLSELLYAKDDVITPNEQPTTQDGNQNETETMPDVENPTSNGCTHVYVVVENITADYENYGYKKSMCSLCNEVREEYQDKLIDTSYLAPRLYNNITIEGRYGWLFYAGANNINYYLGNNVLPEKTMAEWLKTMEKLQSVCDKKGIKLVYAIFPNKEQVYFEYLPTYKVVNSYKRVEQFVDYVNNNSTINIVYPLNELMNYKRGYQLYYKHDTHWNSAGAFVGMQAILKTLDMETVELNDVKSIKEERYVGDLLNLGNLTQSKFGKDYDYTITYKPEINIQKTTGNIQEIYCVESDSEHNEKLVVVGDSYRIMLASQMYKDFNESVYMHRNSLVDAETKKYFSDVDVLVVSAIERYDATLIDSAILLTNILSSN